MSDRKYYQKRSFTDEHKLPDDYLSSGYFDSEGNILEKLVTDWAEKIAKRLRPTKKHQIRRFYHHVKAIEKKMELIGDYKSVNTDLKKLIPMAVSASNRESLRVSPLFEQFIRRNLAAVNDKKTFRAFLEHFQAVIGFCERYLRD